MHARPEGHDGVGLFQRELDLHSPVHTTSLPLVQPENKPHNTSVLLLDRRIQPGIVSRHDLPPHVVVAEQLGLFRHHELFRTRVCHLLYDTGESFNVWSQPPAHRIGINYP